MSAKRCAAAPSQAPTWSLETEAVQRWGALLLAGLAVLMAVVTFDPRIDPEADSADYLVLGRALHAGQGLRYVHLPDAPRAEKFPPGFPLLLAGVEWLAPASVVAPKVLVAACYVGAVVLTFSLAFTYVAPLPAFLVTLLVALNPFVLGMARIVMSELPYLCLSLLALWGLERALAGPGQWGAWGGGLLALLCATQVRTLGWSLLLALLLVLLLQRRYRTLGLVLGGVGLLVGLGILGGVGPMGREYFGIWQERMTTPEATGTAGGTSVLSRIITSGVRYGLIVIPGMILPSLWPVPLTFHRGLPSIFSAWSGSVWVWVIQVPLAGLCLLVLGLGAWPSLRCLRLTPFYTAAFTATLFFWPPEFSWGRMLVPVIPFFFLFGAIGLHRLRTWARPSVPALDRLVPVLVVSLILAQLWGSVSLGALNSDYSPVWAERVRLAEWVRTHTDPQDLVLTDFPAQLYLLSGRKADFLLSRRGKDKQGFRTLAQLFQYIDDTKAKYLVDDGSVGRLKALKRELFAHVEQPDSGWRVVSRGRLGAIYVRSDTRTTPQPGE